MLRIFLGMMVVAGMGFGQPAMAADWSSAPKFCELKSLVPWKMPSERQPCHCPPQSKCPKPINITSSASDLKKLKFFVKERTSYTINGSDVPKLKSGEVAPMDVFKMSGNELIDLLGLNKEYRRWTTHITVAFEGEDRKLEMPWEIVNQCCDNPCADGMTLQLETLTVPVPYSPDFGLTLDNAQVDQIKKDLDDLALALDIIKNNANLIDLTKEISAALDAYFLYEYSVDPEKTDPKTDPESAKEVTMQLLQKLINKTGSFDTLADGLPLGFRQDNKTTLSEISKLNKSATEELKKYTEKQKTTQVQVLKCVEPPVTVLREGCILSGTLITLADGTTKPIESLKVGDQLQGHNGVGVILAKSKFSQREDTMYSINKGEAFFTVEHPILTTQGWKSVDATVTSAVGDTIIVGSLAVGDVLLLAGGKELTVTSIDKKPLTNGVDAYNLSLTGDGSFIAQGFIMKGFKKMQMHY